ncbi:winged helix DNA-binding domain-containing protein [Angustibacter peucedani]
MSITWSQALSWRMQRQLLEPTGSSPVEDVVQRLGAVLAMDARAAELAVRTRMQRSQPDELDRARADGRVVVVFAFRGATHHMDPRDAGAYLTLRASGRQWELPSWQEYYRLTPDDWPAFRAAVRDALDDGPLTVQELGAALARRPRYRHLRPFFDEGASTLAKPLTWQGDMSLGPRRDDGRRTFQRLDTNPFWRGDWELDEAGRYAVEAYLRAYGPATPDHLQHWLGSNLSAGRRRVDRWFAELRADRLAEVDVEGTTAYVLGDDLADLEATRASDAVRLLPGHDQWVMAPGTKDEAVVPPSHRDPVTRKADLVVAGGVVSGTWTAKRGDLAVTWFGDRGRVPRQQLQEQADRLGELLGRELALTVEKA